MYWDINDLFSFNFSTYQKILDVWWKKWADALALYIRYIKQARMQWKKDTFSLDRFMIKTMKWWKNKFYEVKKILVDLWLIEQLRLQWWEVKIKVNFIISENKIADISEVEDKKSDIFKTGIAEEKAIENKDKEDSASQSKNPAIPKTQISAKPVVFKMKTQNNKEYNNIKYKYYIIINNNTENKFSEKSKEEKEISSYKNLEDKNSELKQEQSKQESEKDSAPENVELWKTSKEVVKKQITEDINNFISELKNNCDKLGIAYDKNKERQFSKHILTAKDFWEFCEKIGQTRLQFALNILLVSEKIGFWKGVCSWPKRIYQNYVEVYNLAKSKKNNLSIKQKWWVLTI